MKVKASIDRFEGTKAILFLDEGESQLVWPRTYLPTGTQEGDILSLYIEIDAEATAQAKTEAENLLKELMENNQ